jgi:hypothetical protein
VQYDFTTSDYTRIGSVWPPVQWLAPGQTGKVTVRLPLSANPGDQSASLQLATGNGVRSSVPISLRSVVKPSRHGSSTFHGTITGGNGRDLPAQTNTYYIDVPKHAPSVSVGVRLANTVNPDDVLFGYLIAPDGQTLAVDSNVRFDDQGNGQTIGAMQLTHRAPQAGRWRFVLEQANPVSGAKIRQPFTGTVSLAPAAVSVSAAMPAGAKATLRAGHAVSVKVKVRNTGVAPQAYFADGRLTTTGNLTLASQVPGDNLGSETLPESSVTPMWLLPTAMDQASFTAAATVPVEMDAGYAPGDPEVFGSGGTTSTATASAAELAPGIWLGNVGEIGPFDGPAPAGTVALTAVARGQLFDPAISSSTGDFWQTALVPPAASAASVKAASHKSSQWLAAARRQATKANPAEAATGPLLLSPGEAGYITVTVTPHGSAGSLTTGTLNIDTVDLYDGAGSEVASLPYKYEIK